VPALVDQVGVRLLSIAGLAQYQSGEPRILGLWTAPGTNQPICWAFIPLHSRYLAQMGDPTALICPLYPFPRQLSQG